MTKIDDSIDRGHIYKLEGTNNTIRFMRKEGGQVVYGGTTNEELILVLIDRLLYLNSKFPCIENANAIYSLNVALDHLESRTKNRVARGVEGQDIV